MSEDGWQSFLSSDGVDDWVILHGGPTAVFTTASLQEAARLAAAMAELPGLGPRTLLTAASDRLTLNHAMHIDVSLAREHIGARVAAALSAGGRVVDDSEAPSAWILADRSGNRVCLAAWPDGALPANADNA